MFFFTETIANVSVDSECCVICLFCAKKIESFDEYQTKANHIQEELLNQLEMSEDFVIIKPEEVTRAKENCEMTKSESSSDEDSTSREERNESLSTFLNSHFVKRMIKVTNEILRNGKCSKIISEKDVTATYNPKKKTFSAKVKCPICLKTIAANMTKYSTSMTNFKRHFSMHQLSDPSKKMPGKENVKKNELTTRNEKNVSSSFLCPICAVKFETTQMLIKHHMKAHAENDSKEIKQLETKSQKTKSQPTAQPQPYTPKEIASKSLDLKDFDNSFNGIDLEYGIGIDDDTNESLSDDADYWGDENNVMNHEVEEEALKRTVTIDPSEIIAAFLGSKFVTRMIKVTNDILDNASIKESIDKCDIKAWYDKRTKNCLAKVRCVVCSKMISVNMTKYSTSMTNYKRHVIVHQMKNEEVSKDTTNSSIIKPDSETGSDVNTVANKFKCETCGKTFKSGILLKCHQVIHKERTIFTCDICGATFLRRSRFNKHCVKRHLLQQKYSCSKCSKSYYQKGHLKNHMLSHSKVHSCSICSKIFKNRFVLGIHEVTHVKDKNVQCATCNKKFRTEFHLSKHVANIHQSREMYTCDRCGEMYRYKRSLCTHYMTVHTNQRNFMCEQCPNTFASDVALRAHLLTHKDVRNEVCEKCSKSFHTKYRLERHLRTHQSTGNYVCQTCSRSFRENYQLIAHMRRLHSTDEQKEIRKIHSCSICDRKFDRPGLLRKHLTNAHELAMNSEPNME